MGALRLSIRTKLLASSLLLIVLAAVISLLAITRLGDVKDEGSNLYTKTYTPTTVAIYVNGVAKDLALQSTNLQPRGRRARWRPRRRRQGPARRQARQGHPEGPEDAEVGRPMLADAPANVQGYVAKIAGGVKSYNSHLAVIMKLKPDDPRNATYGAKLGKDIALIDSASTAMTTSSDKNAKAASQRIRDSYSSGRTLILGALILTIILGLATALFISGQIKRGVTRIRKQLSSLRENDTASLRDGLVAISEGDLTRRAAVVTQPRGRRSSDEIGDIAEMVDEITLDTARRSRATTRRWTPWPA